MTVSDMPTRISNLGGSWTLLGTADFTVNTTSTSAASTGTIQAGASAFTANEIIFVRVRDKAGKRAGYFYGSDSFFINVNKANNNTTTLSAAGRSILRYTTSNAYAQYTTATTTGYGVYGYSITSAGAVAIYQRYNSSYSLTINGTYKVDVYKLEMPTGVVLFG